MRVATLKRITHFEAKICRRLRNENVSLSQALPAEETVKRNHAMKRDKLVLGEYVQVVERHF
jgi:heme oxygenase